MPVTDDSNFNNVPDNWQQQQKTGIKPPAIPPATNARFPQPSVAAQTFTNYANNAQQRPTGQPTLTTPLPGQNGYTPTTAPYGMDQSNPGVQEQYWNQNQNLWNKGMSGGPGQGEQFWNQVQGNFNKASQDLSPQFNKYYDNARNTAVGEQNKQSAARGVYGSSQALNGVGNVISDVEGQRAKASTDFMFQNAANQNQALNNYGNMAFGAQNQSNNRNSLNLSMLNSGFAASGQAQNQRGNRIQGALDNGYRQQQSALDFMQGQYNGLFDADQGIYTGATQGGPAVTGAAVNASDKRADNYYKTIDAAGNFIGAVKGK